jgi:3-oxosteroid 1-dehydrogenase
MSAQTWDYECDVLAVGSGAGGLTAAVVAADCKAEALVIEKGIRFGGTSAMSGAVLWIPASHLAAAAGHAEAPGEALQYLKALTAGDVAEELLLAYIDHGPRMLRYLQEHTDVKYVSIPYPDYHAGMPGGKLGWRSHDCVALDGRVLGADLDSLEWPHRANMLFGRYVWSAAEAGKLITRTPGWVAALTRTLWRHYSDVGQRLRSPRSRFLTGGNALVARLKLSLDRRRVPLWRQARLIELVRDSRRVVGAVIEREGRRQRISARRAVILACGGFESSAPLRSQYLVGSHDPDWSGCQGNNTGDGLLAARAIGAATDRLDSAWWSPALRVRGEPYARPLFIERSLPGSIIVNQAGRRYMNEAPSYHIAGRGMIENDAPHAGTSPSFILFDARYHRRYPMGPVLPMMPYWMLPRAVREILFRARSWEELARQLRIDPAALTGTIERFNAQARAGHDPDFGRGEQAFDRLYGDAKIMPNPNLHPLDEPPYYALAIYPGDIGTNGGLRTNVQAQVLDTQGNVIDGLYATGNVTASVMGRSYPGGGATLGPAMTFAFVAARHALGQMTSSEPARAGLAASHR